MFNFSSRGPREDGGLKPNITAPGSAISTVPLWQAGQPVAEAGYPLPPGYGMFNGTSMASPMAAGGAALLLSAGRATNTPISPAVLRQGIYSTADYNPIVPAVAQGFGQMDVPGAWSLLAPRVLGPRTHGVHSAVLRIDDPRSPGLDAATMATVVAAQQLVEPSYSVSAEGQIGRASCRERV